ncbi:MAG: AAA family ATPase [Candidatus Margulisiibacteriota bacterium]
MDNFDKRHVCDECNQKPATVHVTRIVNGQKVVRHLCSDCAEKLGFMSADMSFPGFFEIPDIFTSFFKRRPERIYDYFSDSAQNAIHLAREEAKRLKHSHLTPEHLLLGLIKEESLSYNILEGLGINLVELFSDIESLIGRGDVSRKEITLSPRAKKVLELSYNAARELGLNFVGSEHILLGIIREGESIAAQSLRKRKVTYDKVLNQLIEEIEKGRPQQQLPPEEPPQFGAEDLPIEGMGPGGMEGGPEGFFGMPGFGMGGTAMRPQQAKTALSSFGRDLTDDAKNERLDPVIDREKEVDRVIRILSRRTKNNPALLGDPGVGKTAIVEGLANRIISGEVPDVLRDKQIFALDLGGMVAGTKYRGEFEARLKKVIDEILKKKRKIILFIDELHTLVGAGAAEGAIDAANMLKPSLARGELQVIGATTVDEYRKNIEKDPALERRFQPVMINEPTKELAIQILKGIKHKYEQHHSVRIPDATIVAAVSLADRYITDRFLPDKAIDVMDEAGAKVRLRLLAPTDEQKEVRQQLEDVKKEKEEAITAQKFEKAASLRDKINALEDRIKKLQEKARGEGRMATVTEDDVSEVVSDWTGIPVIKLTAAETEKLVRMEEALHKRVIGQEEAVVAISQAIRRGRAGLKAPERPVGSFIFAGPTGVGKTEVARRLAEFLFGTMDAMVRVDMSEYMEKHSVSRLTGAPPGYVGYEEGGALTEAVRRKPYSVILFDEIEKAHPDVFNVLLQVLEDGRLTDSKGHTVDFKNTVIIMTTNVGQRQIVKEGAIGFMTREDREASYEKMKDTVMEDMKKVFRPEFLNRIDEIIVFHPLDEGQLKQIAGLMISDVQKNVECNQMKLEIADEVKALIVKEGFDPKFGARPLRRAVQKFIENPLSNEIIEGKFKAGDVVMASADKNKVVFEKIDTFDVKPKADVCEDTSITRPKPTEVKESGDEERRKRGRKRTK